MTAAEIIETISRNTEIVSQEEINRNWDNPEWSKRWSLAIDQAARRAPLEKEFTGVVCYLVPHLYHGPSRTNFYIDRSTGNMHVHVG